MTTFDQTRVRTKIDLDLRMRLVISLGVGGTRAFVEEGCDARKDCYWLGGYLFSLENGLEAMRCGADVEICKKLRVSGIRIQVTSNMIVAEGV